MQLGGMPRMTVHFASQYLRVLREQARRAKKSHALLFIDISSAFYRISRHVLAGDPFALGDQVHDEDVCVSTLTQSSALEELQVKPLLRKWIYNIMGHSWSQVQTSLLPENADVAMLSRRGSRPGDPVSDLAFSAGMTQILRQVTTVVHHLLHVDLGAGVHFQTTPVTWVDDVAVYVEDTDPHHLIEKTQKIMAAFYQRCHERGLSVNLARGKTEVIFRFEGRGAHGATRRIQELPDHRLPIEVFSQTVSVASLYTHLGQKQCSSMSFEPAMIARRAQARETLTEIMPLLTHRYLSTRAKQVFAAALVFTKLMFGAELWDDVQANAWVSLNAFVVKVQRIILGWRNWSTSAHTTDRQVQAELPYVSACDMARVARLRHFGKLQADAPEDLRTLLDHQFSNHQAGWYVQAVHDCQWLQQFFRPLSSLPDPQSDFQEWKRFASANPRQWSSFCRRVTARAAMHQFMQAQTALWEQRVTTILPPLDATTPAAADSVSQEPIRMFPCHLCPKVCSDAKSLSVHLHMAHEQHAAVRMFMPHPLQCGSCMRHYASTQKLRQHLQHRPDRCLAHLQEVWHPMTSEQVAEVETVPNRRLTTHREQALQAYGPLLPSRQEWLMSVPTKTLPVSSGATDGHQVAPFLHWLDEWARGDVTFDDFPADAAATQQDLYAALRRIVEEVATRGGASDSVCWEPMLQFCHAQLRAEVPKPAEQPTVAVESLPVDQGLPIHEGATYALYLYAGHRREGDIHQAAAELSQAYCMDLRIIPVDIVYCNCGAAWHSVDHGTPSPQSQCEPGSFCVVFTFFAGA